MPGPITVYHRSRKIMNVGAAVGGFGLGAFLGVSIAEPVGYLAGIPWSDATWRPLFLKLQAIRDLGAVLAATGAVIIVFGLFYRSHGRTY